MSISRWFVAGIFVLLWQASYADEREKCETHSEGEARLCTYEPNTVGFTNDSDDVGFMDFKLSVRYQMFPDWITRGLNNVRHDLGNDTALYFAATVRFGQYIGTRESSPVIAKRFNPKFFVRRWTDNEHREYIDFAFLAHESNGQSITTPEQFQQAQQALINAGQSTEFAKDHISRGWDYLELVWKKVPIAGQGTLSTYVTLKYFLSDGPFQGKPEEFNTWENDPEGKPRNQVNGVAGLAKYHWKEKWGLFEDLKFVAGYETGYREIFKYNTVRLEIGTKVMQLPLNLWGQTGYNSDLAQYYKKVTSWGIEVQIGSF
jgi:hypothetical protein